MNGMYLESNTCMNPSQHRMKKITRDQRIFSTGCAGNKLSLTTSSQNLIIEAEEQLRMNDCYYDKKDWRACKTEVGVKPQRRCFAKSSFPSSSAGRAGCEKNGS